MMLGVFDRAEAATRDGLRRAEELGLTRAVAAARHNLGLILAQRGDIPAGLREEMEAVEAMARMHDERLVTSSRIYLAIIQEMAGDLASAEATARRAVRDMQKLPPIWARTYATLVRVLLRAGKLGEASELEPAFAAALREEMLEGGDIYPGLVHAELLAAMGRAADADAELLSLKERVTERAARIADDTIRVAFLHNVPENARVLALAR
jgi:hypothetical protein